MTILHALILGLVEGLTEFLPVSSTAHLLLGSYVLGIPDWEFVETFVVFIQIGAMGAVLLLSWQSFLKRALLSRILVAFVPTAIIGLLLHNIVHDFFFDSLIVIVCALVLGSVLILLVDRKKNQESLLDLAQVSHKKFFLIGVFQSLAIIPGVSRSLASMFGGVTVGLSKKDAVLFSFLLAVPTIGAAGLYDLSKSSVAFLPHTYELAIGFLVSFVVAYYVMKWFISFIQEKSLWYFAVYRIILAILILIFLI